MLLFLFISAKIRVSVLVARYLFQRYAFTFNFILKISLIIIVPFSIIFLTIIAYSKINLIGL
jgi:hypothetical protein